MKTTKLAHGELTGRMISGFFECCNELGSGFPEKVSRNALAIVFRDLGLQVSAEVPLPVHFRGKLIGQFYADLVVNDTILVEVKTSPSLEPYMEAQVLNYLKAAGGGVGLLFNFGSKPQHKRFVYGDPENSLPSLTKGISAGSDVHGASTGAIGPRGAREGSDEPAPTSSS